LITLNDRFRRLVVFLRRARLRALGAAGIDRSSRQVASPSVDFRPAGPGSRPELERVAQRYGVDLARAPLDMQGAVATPSASARTARMSAAADAGLRGRPSTIHGCSAPTHRCSG
jgi:hypothetical protein